MRKKLTYEYVYNYFLKFGYTLISNTYESAHELLDVMCPEGHIYKVQYANFYSGRRCPICYLINKKHPYDYIKNYIEKFNYKLLSSEYIRNNDLLDLQCPNKHIIKMAFHNFYQGQRCPYCQGLILTYDYIKDFIESFGYKLLSKEYENATYQLLLIECPEGHQYETTFGNFRSGHRCNICIRKNMRGENHHNWKGGISALNNKLRGLLFDNWTYNCLEKYNFKCAITGLKYNKKDTLEVHHLYNFHKIVTNVLNELKLPVYETIGEYKPEEINSIENLFLKYHIINIGVPILKSIHTFYHYLYSDDNTPQQFKEFMTRLRLGEFNDFLEGNNLTLDINYEVLDKLLNKEVGDKNGWYNKNAFDQQSG